MRPVRTVPRLLLSAAAAQEGLVGKAQCDAVGVNKDAVALLIRQGRWSRVARGVYDTDPERAERHPRGDCYDHLRRRAAWVGMLAVPDGIATGACALALLGIGGLPAALVPALAQALPYLSRHEAVAVLSDALRAGRLDEKGLRQVRSHLRGRRGAARVHRQLGLADGRDGSTAETHARLSFIDHGVPPDGQQVTFVADGVVLARVDFAWRLIDGRYVVVEIDGRAFHSGEAMLADDAARQNRLVATGRVIVLRFAAARALAGAVPGVGAEMAERLAGLGWRPGAPIASTVDVGGTGSRGR
jgi:hypothetical protein